MTILCLVFVSLTLLVYRDCSSIKEIKIQSFTLSVTGTKTESVDLIESNIRTVLPGSNIVLSCSANGRPSPSVIITDKQKTVVRVDPQPNVNVTQVVHRIRNIDCNQAASFTCWALNTHESKNLSAEIAIKCPTNEARFDSKINDHFVAVSKDNQRLLLICEDNNPPQSMTLVADRDRRHPLNYTEHSSRISYQFPVITCNDMGKYLCLVNRTKSPLNGKDIKPGFSGYEKTMSISVNNCPPRICKSDQHDMGTSHYNASHVSIHLCLDISIGTKILAVFYAGHWVTNGTCRHPACLTIQRDPSSKFRHYMNVTFLRVNLTQSIIDFKIGSGYNFRENHLTRRINLQDESLTVQTTEGSIYNDEQDKVTTFVVYPVTNGTPSSSITDNDNDSQSTRSGDVSAMITVIAPLAAVVLVIAIMTVFIFCICRGRKSKPQRPDSGLPTWTPCTILGGYDEEYDGNHFSSLITLKEKVRDEELYRSMGRAMTRTYVNTAAPLLIQREGKDPPGKTVARRSLNPAPCFEPSQRENCIPKSKTLPANIMMDNDGYLEPMLW